MFSAESSREATPVSKIITTPRKSKGVEPVTPLSAKSIPYLELTPERPASPDGPKFSVRQKPHNRCKFIGSRTTLYILIGLTVVLWISVIPAFLPPNYCLKPDQTNCEPCPKNAVCERGEFKCMDDALSIRGMCIKNGTVEQRALRYASIAYPQLNSRKIKNTAELAEYLNITTSDEELISMIVQLSDGYELQDDSIVPVFSTKKKLGITLLSSTALAIALVKHYYSYFGE